MALLTLIAVLLAIACWPARQEETLGESQRTIDAREEVLFWHFWGGADRKIVEQVVARFNDSQSQYRVRPVAMPGNNLDLKVFLAVTGGDPPDVINQDDPILGDWADRGALQALDEFASPEEIAELDTWLFPAAQRLTRFHDRYYGLCNGLDIRALYYNKTWFDELHLAPPQSIEELDSIAETIAPPSNERREQYGFLPDGRRLAAWSPAFGGGVFASENGSIVLDTPANEATLTWMIGYRKRYGAANLAAFRTGDQSLPGKTFPLLSKRYAMLMDGQWRVRDIRAAQSSQRERGEPVTEYAVCPLPKSQDGRADAGWVNGNFFVVPRGAKCTAGAWAFMKFWSGFGGNEAAAAQTSIAGGWIPVSQRVVSEPAFQSYLEDEPLFATFVALAGSENQFPLPVVPGAAGLRREIESIGERALSDDRANDAAEILQQAQTRIAEHLKRQRSNVGKSGYGHRTDAIISRSEMATKKKANKQRATP